MNNPEHYEIPKYIEVIEKDQDCAGRRKSASLPRETHPVRDSSVIGAFLVEAPNVSLDVADQLLLVWKVRFPYEGTITKHPHTLSLERASSWNFTVVGDVNNRLCRVKT